MEDMQREVRPIFMVDDNLNEFYIAERCYKMSGLHHPFRHITSGVDLIQFLQDADPSHLPHVVLMDINMPGINGIEATRKIRSIAEFEKSIYIIILTNSDNPRDYFDAKEAGANEVMTKPDSIEEYRDFFTRLKTIN
ncbi:response regulator [Halobacteriovorax sp. GB3]|uniref:response regulator n=1 Tax=Halobacteriovorax sp. GB3 TaxID=2719615 RepID=UPI00236251B5|nr:response regulator [Halobacteriovorax sp. GB3]MDD0854018.1 response regulator [Halobacteriovorax sp. GB3]